MTRNSNKPARKISPKSFTPGYAVPPGQTLEETMAAASMTQTELALRTGLSRKTINGIVKGREPLTPDTSLRLEKVFRVPAHFWNNLQRNYDEARARLRERELLAQYIDWPRQVGIPVRDLVRRGLIPDSRDKIELLSAILQFFGVATPAEFAAVWSAAQTEWAARQNGQKTTFGAFATQLRIAQLQSSPA